MDEDLPDSVAAIAGDSVGSRPRLAALLARLRAERGLTLDVLAEASGVSRAFISQIESGRANPTLATLDRLAGALGTPAADLLSDGAGRSEFEPVLRPARPVGEWAPGAGRTYQLSAPEARRLAVHLTDGAAADHELWVEHPGEEFCLVLAGTYRLHLENQHFILGAGASVHYPSTLLHRISPEGPSGRVLVAFGPVHPHL